MRPSVLQPKMSITDDVAAGDNLRSFCFHAVENWGTT
jgi:hypothetical protein